MFVRTRLLLLIVSVLALVLAACSEPEVVGVDEPADEPDVADEEEEADAGEEEPAEDPTGDPVLVGSLHPLTGGLADDGNAMDDAIQMAIDDINEAGGISSLGGAPLEKLSADSQGDPAVGQTEAQRMIDQGVVAIIGAFQSAVAVNVAAQAERSQVPFIIDVGVADAIITDQSRYTFRIQPNATDNGVYGIQTLTELAEATGEEISRVIHLHDETEFGTSINAVLTSEAEAAGIEVVESISYNPFEVSDLTTELSRVEAAGVDVLLATGYYPDGVLLAREAMAVEPNIKAVIGIASGAFDIDEFPEDTGDAGEYYLNSNYHYDATNPRTQEIRARYEERFGRPMRTGAVLAYQAVEVLADALEHAGSADHEAVRDAISETVIDDPLLAFEGPIQFDETGENESARPIVMQVRDGEILQVYPETFAETDLLFPATPWNPPN